MSRRFTIAVAIAAQLAAGVCLAQSEAPRRIDGWSGLIVACKTDAKLALAGEVCVGIVAEAARQASAGKVKFIALAANHTPAQQTAMAKAAGFDDDMAIELTINIHVPDKATEIAAIDIDALSRQHIMPSRPGQPTQYAKIFMQSAALARGGADWKQAVAPSAKQLLGMFFDLYLKPRPPKN